MILFPKYVSRPPLRTLSPIPQKEQLSGLSRRRRGCEAHYSFPRLRKPGSALQDKNLHEILESNWPRNRSRGHQDLDARRF